MVSVKQIRDYAKFMSADELSQLRSFVNSQEFQSIYWEKHESDRQAGLLKYQKSRKAREERQAKLQTEVYPYLKQYCKEWIKPGDIVRFEGTKNSGIRKVVEITQHGIIGLVVTRIKGGEPQLSGYSSENSFEKLIEVYKIDLGNDETHTKIKCWYNRKSIVEFVKKQNNES
jgi:hypothetical protein